MEKSTYENASNELKQRIRIIIQEDKYGLMEKTLFNNIKYSTGTDESIAGIFHVPVDMVKEIKTNS